MAFVETLVTGLSSFQQASYQAQVARNNAKIAEENANREATRAQQEQLRSDREFRALGAEQIAAQSVSGLDVDSPSALLVRESTRRVRGEQALDIRRAGESATARLFQDAANFKGEANAAEAEAFNAILGTVAGIGSDIASGGSSSLIGGSRSTRRGSR